MNPKHRSSWNRNLWVISLLLGLWFVLSFVLMYFARELTFNFFGWPFSFWVAGQGAPFAYCLIIFFYARYMNRLDAEHDRAEAEA